MSQTPIAAPEPSRCIPPQEDENMKKAAVILIAAILSVICLVPAFAADKREIGVFAKSVYTLSEGCYAAEEEDGGYTADGTL